MKHEDFEKTLNRRIMLIKKVLADKNKEYANDDDRLHNFKRAGQMLGCSPEKALIGMQAKHIISILDIINDLESKCGMNEDCFPSYDTSSFMALIEEKIGDAINYFILLEALLKERYDEVGIHGD